MIKDVLGFKLSQGFRGVGVETPFSLRWDVDFFLFLGVVGGNQASGGLVKRGEGGVGRSGSGSGCGQVVCYGLGVLFVANVLISCRVSSVGSYSCGDWLWGGVLKRSF